MKVTYKELMEMSKAYKNVSVRYIDEEDGEISVSGFTEERKVQEFGTAARLEEGWYQNKVYMEINTNLGIIHYSESIYKGDSDKLIIPDYVWERVERIIRQYVNLREDQKKTKIIINGEVFKSLLEIMERRDNGKLLSSTNYKVLHKGDVIYIGEYSDPYGEEYCVEYFDSESGAEAYEAYAYGSGEKMEPLRIRKVEG